MAKTEEKNINLGQGTGRRKTAVARVYLREGNGKITINGRELEDYFKDPLCIYQVKQPLDVTDTLTKFDIVITVSGGGPSGQAGACRHGIARALVAENEANKPVLVKFDSETTNPEFGNGVVYGGQTAGSVTAPAGSKINLVGTYTEASLTATDNSDAYVMKGNKLYNVDSEVSIKPFRGYFTYSEGNSASSGIAANKWAGAHRLRAVRQPRNA